MILNSWRGLFSTFLHIKLDLDSHPKGSSWGLVIVMPAEWERQALHHGWPPGGCRAVMVFIGERKRLGASSEHTWARLVMEAEGGAGGRVQNLLSCLGLGKTISCCSFFFKKILATCLGDLGSGATSVLQ